VRNLVPLTKYKWLLIVCFSAFYLGNPYLAKSQITSVTTIQNLSFGAISQGNSGGTVIINSSGSRTTTGSVVPINLGISYFQAIFEIEAPRGTIVSILNGPDATLTGSNGGTMSLHIGIAEPGTPFQTDVEPPGKTQVSVGGTLTIGDAATSPPGNYNASFYITFNNE
jgi:hypothetical protein